MHNFHTKIDQFCSYTGANKKLHKNCSCRRGLSPLFISNRQKGKIKLNHCNCFISIWVKYTFCFQKCGGWKFKNWIKKNSQIWDIVWNQFVPWCPELFGHPRIFGNQNVRALVAPRNPNPPPPLLSARQFAKKSFTSPSFNIPEKNNLNVHITRQK